MIAVWLLATGATAVRRENGWRFIAVHFSNNTFENAVLDKTKSFAWYGAGGSLAARAAAMWLFVRVRSKTKSQEGDHA
jgi:hypothetical protein